MTKENKFKLGDKVEVIKTDEDGYKLGTIGEIVIVYKEASDNQFYAIEFEGEEATYAEHELRKPVYTLSNGKTTTSLKKKTIS